MSVLTNKVGDMNIKKNIIKRSVDTQIVVNQMLVSQIRDIFNFLEPELSNEQILEKLIIALTPMADTQLLNAFNDYLVVQGDNKLNEVKELYAKFFSDTETPNDN